MSDEVLKRLDSMERGIKGEIASNRTAIETNRVALFGELKRVEQKIDLHMCWEKEERGKFDDRLTAAEKKVNDVNVSTAENKARIGLFSVLGGSGAFGLWEIVTRLLSSTPKN